MPVDFFINVIAIQIVFKLLNIQAELLGIGNKGCLGARLWCPVRLPFKKNVVHFPEFSLNAGGLCRTRGCFRVRVRLGKRKMAERKRFALFQEYGTRKNYASAVPVRSFQRRREAASSRRRHSLWRRTAGLHFTKVSPREDLNLQSTP